jgi:hypothetical protein
MSHLKSIAFESEEVTLQKRRERLLQMSDEELIKFGLLQVAREEWRRRRPKKRGPSHACHSPKGASRLLRCARMIALTGR